MPTRKQIMLLYMIGGSLGLLGTIWFFLDFLLPRKFKHKKLGKADQPVEYKLGSPKVPPLSGLSILIAKWLGRTGFKSLLIYSSQRRSNLHLLRSLVIPDWPTITPLPLPSWKTTEVKEENVDLQGLIKTSDANEGSFHFVSISDLLEAYRSGTTTPLIVANLIIQRIKEFDKMKPPLRAITQCVESEILKMATASTQRYAEKKPLSIFDGIPVAIKEEYSVIPYHLRNGTTYMGTEPCTEDAAVVKKLRDGGAMIIGMSNMHEIGIGITGSNVNRLHGTPRNPYNVQHYTGGSSSGSAAAVASGLCLIGLGTDGGGSIRVPAASCGVVGLKASFGRINTAGVVHIGHTITHAGPICNNVRDAAIVYAFLAGPNVGDPSSLNQPAISLKDFETCSLEGLSLGVDWRFFKHTDPEVLECCEEALKFLESRGAHIVEIQIPELEEARVAHTVTILTEMATGMESYFHKNYSEMNPDAALSLSLGRAFNAIDYYQAQKQRTRSMGFLEKVFQDDGVDCIITPGLGMKVPRIPSDALMYGEANSDNLSGMMRYMQLGNLTGVPGVTLPVGYDSNGLPISLQVMSGWWQEHVMLRVAHACEGFLVKRKPEVHCDLLER